MIRPGVTLMLWFAIAALVLVNNMIGDTLMADRLTVLQVEWYKVLVPLPYVIMMAVLHARRCAGPTPVGGRSALRRQSSQSNRSS